MKKLSVVEWIAVCIALVGAAVVFTVGGASQQFGTLDVRSESQDVDMDMPTHDSDTDEMVAEGSDSEVLGEVTTDEGEVVEVAEGSSDSILEVEE